MDVILKIDIEGSNPTDIQNEALMFSRIAASQQEFTVTRPEDATPEPGQKGAEIELGTLLVALVTSGAVTAMINVLKVYLVRDKSLVVEFENPDGRKVKLSSNNVKPEHLKETMASLKDVMGAMS